MDATRWMFRVCDEKSSYHRIKAWNIDEVKVCNIFTLIYHHHLQKMFDVRYDGACLLEDGNSNEIVVKIWFQNRRMKWRNSKERELLSNGGTREQTLPTKNNPNPDLSDPVCTKSSTNGCVSRLGLYSSINSLSKSKTIMSSSPSSTASSSSSSASSTSFLKNLKGTSSATSSSIKSSLQNPISSSSTITSSSMNNYSICDTISNKKINANNSYLYNDNALSSNHLQYNQQQQHRQQHSNQHRINQHHNPKGSGNVKTIKSVTELISSSTESCKNKTKKLIEERKRNVAMDSERFRSNNDERDIAIVSDCDVNIKDDISDDCELRIKNDHREFNDDDGKEVDENDNADDLNDENNSDDDNNNEDDENEDEDLNDVDDDRDEDGNTCASDEEIKVEDD
ncbi:Homeobox protein DBX1 [Sarcoptes scabiei]|uniref:Homeobox protein DBX1 n=1 Tax=Sarcoptes scabiei TaxID=52283 RepID=A0A834R8X2_SARSC|nr:Homeobox protein DBX1 [Sarcoptes scabiei]